MMPENLKKDSYNMQFGNSRLVHILSKHLLLPSCSEKIGSIWGLNWGPEGPLLGLVREESRTFFFLAFSCNTSL